MHFPQHTQLCPRYSSAYSSTWRCSAHGILYLRNSKCVPVAACGIINKGCTINPFGYHGSLQLIRAKIEQCSANLLFSFIQTMQYYQRLALNSLFSFILEEIRADYAAWSKCSPNSHFLWIQSTLQYFSRIFLGHKCSSLLDCVALHFTWTEFDWICTCLYLTDDRYGDDIPSHLGVMARSNRNTQFDTPCIQEYTGSMDWLYTPWSYIEYQSNDLPDDPGGSARTKTILTQSHIRFDLLRVNGELFCIRAQPTAK